MMNDNTVIFGFFFSVIVALLPSCGGSGTEGDPLADCGKLGIAYGSVFTNKTTVGGKATYTCDDGYELNGKVMRTCGAFGNWSGEAPTCEDIDECASNNGGCDRNATCTNNARFAATCVCKDGYTGDGMTCSDVDECLLDNGGCHLNATCTNTTGSRTCACKNGYSGDGENCVATLCGANEKVVGHTCVACEAGKTNIAGDAANGPDTGCCTEPLGGQYVIGICTDDVDTTFKDCTQPKPNEYVADACVPGSPSRVGEDATMANISSCPLGYRFISVATATADTVCAECTLGSTYSDTPWDGLGECLCPSGYFYARDTSADCWLTSSECVHEEATCYDHDGYPSCLEVDRCWSGSTCEMCQVANCSVCDSGSSCVLCAAGYTLNADGECVTDPTDFDCDNDAGNFVTLNLRIHLMQDTSDWVHSTGVRMNNNHLTSADLVGEFLPELNRIWKQAKVEWVVESVILEEIVHTGSYHEDLAYVLNADGASASNPLPLLHRMMDGRYKSTATQLNAKANLFHVYFFPFIGNTNEGNAMSSYGYSTVVGTWSNKRKNNADVDGYCAPQRRVMSESWAQFDVGSIGQTVGHELGYVLGLSPDDCLGGGGCLMKSNGYALNPDQICTARAHAMERTTL